MIGARLHRLEVTSGPFIVWRALGLIAVGFVMLWVCCGLGGCAYPRQAYIRADRATYEAIEPILWRYVEHDTTIDPEMRELIRLKLDTWRDRIEVAEGVKEAADGDDD